MSDMGVNSAVRDEPEKVEVSSPLAGPGERAAQRLVRVEGPVLDRAVDADEVLVDGPPGADRQVADLRVSHLARRKADVEAGG